MSLPKFTDKVCYKHGLTQYVLEGREYYRCKKCRVEAVLKRRRKLKQLAVEYLGGSCVKCGYNKSVSALDFHHVDPTTKSFGIAENGFTRSWDALQSELDKCILICANCHRELHHEG